MSVLQYLVPFLNLFSFHPRIVVGYGSLLCTIHILCFYEPSNTEETTLLGPYHFLQ